MATVSPITTVYNRQHYLTATIESILAQTYPDFELLIWDDGSSDQSIAIAHQYAEQDPRIRVVTAPHQGIAPALRAAISATTGQYLGWVDSDDVLAPTALEKTVPVLEAHPQVGMVYTDYRVIDAGGKDCGTGKRCRVPYSKDQLLLDFMTFHFRLLRRSVYDQVGGIDPSFVLAEDYDLCLRLSEVTQVHHVPQALYYYRQHAGNITNRQLELVCYAYRASAQALKRRGLEQRYELDVQIMSQFSLRRKPSTTANVQ